MPKKDPAIAVKFTRKELDLLFAEMNSAIQNGAKDTDYLVIRGKVNRARIELIRQSEGQVSRHQATTQTAPNIALSDNSVKTT